MGDTGRVGARGELGSGSKQQNEIQGLIRKDKVLRGGSKRRRRSYSKALNDHWVPNKHWWCSLLNLK